MVKDSFDAANKIKSIPQDILDERYKFASFDVGSLFTNVPLQGSIKLSLDRVYNNKLIPTVVDAEKICALFSGRKLFV